MGKQSSRILMNYQDAKDIVLDGKVLYHEGCQGYAEAAYISDDSGNAIKIWQKMHDNDDKYDHYIFSTVENDKTPINTILFFPNSKYIESADNILYGNSAHLFVGITYYGNLCLAYNCLRSYLYAEITHISNDGFLFKTINLIDYGLSIHHEDSSHCYINEKYIMAYSNKNKKTLFLEINPESLEVIDSKLVNDDLSICYTTDTSTLRYSITPFKDKFLFVGRVNTVDKIYTKFEIKYLSGKGEFSDLVTLSNIYCKRIISLNKNEVYILLGKKLDYRKFVYIVIKITENGVFKSNWFENKIWPKQGTSVDSMSIQGEFIYTSDGYYLFYTKALNSYDAYDNTKRLIYKTTDFINYELVKELKKSILVKDYNEINKPIIICFDIDEYSNIMSNPSISTNYFLIIYSYQFEQIIKHPTLYTTSGVIEYENKIVFNYFYNYENTFVVIVIDNLYFDDSENNYYYRIDDYFKKGYGGGGDKYDPEYMRNLTDYINNYNDSSGE